MIRAAIEVAGKHPDWKVEPEIMIPLVCDVKELKVVKKIVVDTADEEIANAGVDLKYQVGTMIEIPRAALTADEIATEADFFCFGTNDLTQMTFGFSRDDAGKFLEAYYDTKIFENDPFARLDQAGVGKLMDLSIKLGKPVNPNLHVGICGEHGGDPQSVEFCHKIGLDYVSCSPFRVPIARLAAAQAAIQNKDDKASIEDKVSEALKVAGEKANEAGKKASEACNKAKDVALDVASQAGVELNKLGKEALKVGKEVAKASVAGAKAGWKEAKKTYNDLKSDEK